MEVGFGSGEGASGVNEYYKFIGEKEYISYILDFVEYVESVESYMYIQGWKGEK